MIIEFNDDGRIFHVVHDPVPEELSNMFASREDQEHYVVITRTNDTPDVPTMVTPQNHYISIEGNQKYLEERPAFTFEREYTIAADGVDEVLFEGLPDHCAVLVDMQPVSIEGGELIVSSDMPAEYEIRFIAFPYKDHHVKVIAQ